MKRIAGIILIIFISISMAYSQDYKTGLGIRGGLFTGFSVKHFISKQDALEGVVALHYRGMLISGMYQRHARAFDTPGLSWYYGGGGHIGVYEKKYSPWFKPYEIGAFTTFGFIGVVGLEYKIQEIPVSIGADFTPAFNIIGHIGVWPAAGLTLRYTIE